MKIRPVLLAFELFTDLAKLGVIYVRTDGFGPTTGTVCIARVRH